MRRKGASQCNEFTAGCFGQIVIVEILELIVAHVQRCVCGVVQGYKLPATAADFELTNDEGRPTSHIRLAMAELFNRQPNSCHAGHAQRSKYCYDPPHSRSNFAVGRSSRQKILAKLSQKLIFLEVEFLNLQHAAQEGDIL